MWILIAVLTLSVLMNIDLLSKNHDIREDMDRAIWNQAVQVPVKRPGFIRRMVSALFT